ncbi:MULTISPECIES: hypothetical protein [Candidatus Ichthyocystis]|uniref:Uncharacterized protein n=1 Tax=Candidatus Ichthyocystis hellenicum TaxID=1561003 RepID=A0A0S4M935_9BURK|nr:MULTISPECIES: hypothetical protein [Ichthyocystis]CUT17956.1 hypothetical protein Ark11_1143 [Candidatus Ichthyocystis hellenicum]
MKPTCSITSNEKYLVEANNCADITQIVNNDSSVIDRGMACRSFHCISGINISSSMTQIDPELVDSASVADIAHSIENSDLSKYLSSIDKFTAKFMSKSLQYVRAFRFDPHSSGIGSSPAEDSYINYGQHLRSRYVREFVVNSDDYNADIHVVRNNMLSEANDGVYEQYGRLQYMCDYFKYYILESQFECLPYSKDRYEEKFPPLLSAIDKKMKNTIQVNTEFSAKKVAISVQSNSDYENLVMSIKNECLGLVKEKGTLLQIANIKSLKIRYLDNSTRDKIIKSLMEYYLLITDRFESMADLKFKYREALAEKIVLPVPREVAEVVHEEIETERPTSSYHDSKEEHFFCDGNRCLCVSNFGSKYSPWITKNIEFFRLELIRKHVMEDVVNRMKRYILSLNQ